ncbi:hypothetical protein SLA2020_224660 [Shorea laevis]
MEREWKDATAAEDEGGIGGMISGVYLVIWAALLSLCIISAMIFSCAEGVSKNDRTGDSNLYGGGCAAGCGGAECGAGCGG